MDANKILELTAKVRTAKQNVINWNKAEQQALADIEAHNKKVKEAKAELDKMASKTFSELHASHDKIRQELTAAVEAFAVADRALESEIHDEPKPE